MRNRIMVAAVFLVGCAVGGVSSQLVVPKVSAQQQAALTKWEYFCAESSPSEITSTAAKVGIQGWEMSGLTSFPSGIMVPCFKRPKI